MNFRGINLNMSSGEAFSLSVLYFLPFAFVGELCIYCVLFRKIERERTLANNKFNRNQNKIFFFTFGFDQFVLFRLNSSIFSLSRSPKLMERMYLCPMDSKILSIMAFHIVNTLVSQKCIPRDIEINDSAWVIILWTYITNGH